MGVTVIVAGAPWRWRPHFARMAADAELLLAADGGANHLAHIGLMPEMVIGDLDSLDPAVRRWVGESHVLQRGDQDTTDLHKALAYAVDERETRRVTVLAATGGRLDHALENLALLSRWATRVEVDAWDEEAHIVPVRGRAELATTPGQTVSLLPLGRCEGVRSEGLHWPLIGEPLDLAERSGISNLATGERVVVETTAGGLIVFLHATHDSA